MSLQPFTCLIVGAVTVANTSARHQQQQARAAQTKWGAALSACSQQASLRHYFINRPSRPLTTPLDIRHHQQPPTLHIPPPTSKLAHYYHITQPINQLHTLPTITTMSSEGEQQVKLISSDNVEIVTGMRLLLF